MQAFARKIFLLKAFLVFFAFVSLSWSRNLHIDTVELYDKLTWDNVDGGVWRQGWPIEYNNDQWKDEPLKVFVVPFSHNDPGWKKTYHGYYNENTRSIISAVVKGLKQNPKLRFIWTEISFFSLWWSEQNEDTRKIAAGLIENGQLEITTGGWVMCDEANPHYYVILTEIFEGHEWITHNIKPLFKDQKKVIPETAWSIDPFGHSPNIPYFNTLAGLKAGVLNRVHYRVKKEFAKNNLLEFYWKPLLHPFVGSHSEPEIFMHMFPFFAYDIPHTCGPDPKICAVYEFSKTVTFWGDAPVHISDSNIKDKAEKLVDQIKKKSTLFKAKNQVLVSLGDDFLYANDDQWDKLMGNHLKLHEYINSHPELRVKIQFANLSNYLTAAKSKDVGYPSLRGDFYSYADKDNEFWTGYFTSRAFWKHLSRVVESWLRATEMVHSVVLNSNLESSSSQIMKELFLKIVNARRAVSVFQHHDGITGTSANFVVQDYGQMLHTAKEDLIAAHATLLGIAMGKSKPATLNHYEITQEKLAVPGKKILKVPAKEEIPIVLSNSLAQDREEVVSFMANVAGVEVLDAEGNVVAYQINPVFEGSATTPRTDAFEILFMASIPAMGASTYYVKRATIDDKPELFPLITIFTEEKDSAKKKVGVFSDKISAYPIKAAKDQDSLGINNGKTFIEINPSTGLISSVKSKSKAYDVKEDYLLYRDNRAGSYLFLPEGAPQQFSKSPNTIRILEGKIASEIHSIGMDSVQQRTVRLNSRQSSLGIQKVDPVHLIYSVYHSTDNTDLTVRFDSNLKSERQFYTDLNGFQFQERKRRDIDIQGNFYPCTSTLFLHEKTEETYKRFSIHTKQAMSATSLKSGSLELMLDRKLMSDDARGLGQGVPDTLPMLVPMALTFEAVDYPKSSERYYASPSAASHAVSNMLNHPVQIFFGEEKANIQKEWTPIGALPLDLHIVSLKAKKESESGKITDNQMVLHLTRYAFDDIFTSIEHRSHDSALTTETREWFTCFSVESAKEFSLTLLYDKETSQSLLSMKPFDIKTVVLTTASSEGRYCHGMSDSENPKKDREKDDEEDNVASVDVQTVISGNRGGKNVKSAEVATLLGVLLVMSAIGIYLGYKQHKVGFIFVFFAGLNVVVHLLLYHFLSD